MHTNINLALQICFVLHEVVAFGEHALRSLNVIAYE